MIAPSKNYVIHPCRKDTTCDIDLTGADPGQWNLVVTHASAQGVSSELENALEIVEP